MTQIRADFKCQSRISSQSRGVGSVISDLETLSALTVVGMMPAKDVVAAKNTGPRVGRWNAAVPTTGLVAN